MILDVSIPNIGENVESGTVVSIMVSIGDRVVKDDGIIEFETDKALVEIPAPAAGTVVEILVREGDELHIGDTIVRLEAEDHAVDTSAGKKDAEAEEKDAETEEEDAKASDDQPSPPDKMKTETSEEKERHGSRSQDQALGKKERAPSFPESEDRKLPVAAAPSIRRQARELGIDIRRVQGSGPGGRITTKDVNAYVKNRLSASHQNRPAFSEMSSQIELPDFSRWGQVERSDLSTVRRITAESMSLSWRTIPHVTQFDQADISHVEEWLHTVRKDTAQTEGKLTITAVLVKVVAEALKKFHSFNVSLDMGKQQIIRKHYIHIGVAVDTQRGLLVPVIRDVDKKSIMDIAGEINDLSERARKKRITPDEMDGGTFTISNQGGIGGLNFTPIIYWPQAAILGVSRAAVKPLYLDGEWRPRTMLPLSLSYDHRLNDGAGAARFLGWICRALEYPLAMQ